jgi:hypothetical protein
VMIGQSPDLEFQRRIPTLHMNRSQDVSASIGENKQLTRHGNRSVLYGPQCR